MIIIQNAIRTPDGTFLRSFHQHDYQEHYDKNGVLYTVDGGTVQLYRMGDGQEIDLTRFYESSTLEQRRNIMVWGTRGKSGRDQIRFVPIIEMETEHIKNVLKNVSDLPDHYQETFENELIFRCADD